MAKTDDQGLVDATESDALARYFRRHEFATTVVAPAIAEADAHARLEASLALQRKMVRAQRELD